MRTLLLAGFLAMAGGWVGGLRQDELQCEEAVAKLLECCPDFRAEEIACNYSDGCGSTQYPALSIETSECIRDMDCETIVARSVCVRAQMAQPVSIDEDGGTSGSSGSFTGTVCP